MKLTTMAVLAALVVANVRAGHVDKGSKRPVTVYIWGEEQVPFDIRALGLQGASDMFSEIGVSIKWRHSRPAEGQAQRERAVAIHIIGTTGGSSQKTLAAARPYEGSEITVFYGAMKWASQQPRLARVVFAHVLVHEIAHNLQQVSRHSATGIMKERWTSADYTAMQYQPLRFEQFDIDLIHEGLAGRTERMAARASLGVPSLPK
jgi:hypothetical protein